MIPMSDAYSIALSGIDTGKVKGEWVMISTGVCVYLRTGFDYTLMLNDMSMLAMYRTLEEALKKRGVL